MSVLRLVLRGCGYIPGYGRHPGTSFLWMMVGMGALAGLGRGLSYSIVGALVMLAVFGPMYLCGAYGRAKDAAGREALSKGERGS